MNDRKYRQTMFNNEEEHSRARAGGVLSVLKKTTGKKSNDKRKTNVTEGSRRVRKEKKKEKEKEKTTEKDRTDETITMPAPTGAPGPINPVVEHWVQRALDMGVASLRDEFRGLAKYTRADMRLENFQRHSSADINQTKNRYQDVPCQDQAAVLLNSPPAPCPYVHANFVGTSANDKRFICTQGPLDNTIDDFWWMIVQQRVQQIVMLCKTIETGKLKCAQYWPAAVGEKRECRSGIVIENVSGPKPMERDPEIQITMLTVTAEGQQMLVRHLHWTDWPDRGVPPCKLTSLELLSAVRGSRNPIVVHCSAGIGRTGTIVAIEYILERISSSSTEKTVMPELVKQIRDQRAYSIQNDLQYLYIHRIMLFYFLDKYRNKYLKILTPENTEKYTKFVSDYNLAVGQG